MCKNDLQTGRASLAPIVYYRDIDAYKTAFLALHEEIRSWRKIADQYGIYPNMARMISQGYDPGNKIRELLRLPMKDKFEVCPKCKLPMRKNHKCQAKKRNRLSINLNNPESAAKSIMNYMDREGIKEMVLYINNWIYWKEKER